MRAAQRVARPRFQAHLRALTERPAGVALLLLLALAPFYGVLVTRPFASEDFLLLRLLAERPPWRDPVSLLTRPWLDLEVVRFYRPVAWFLLGVEQRLFGASPAAYNLVHQGLHLVNALLVYALGRSLARGSGGAPSEASGAATGTEGDRREDGAGGFAALAAALLFALHPLHPNAVAWIASYATLFAAFFVLGSAVAWERWRWGGGVSWGLAAIGLYLLALGSYEAAVVLPAVLILREVLVGKESPSGGPPAPADGETLHPVAVVRRAVLLTLMTAAGGAYLLLRRLLFGEVIGGYDAFTGRLTDVGALALDALRSFYRLLDPRYPSPSGEPWAPWSVAAVLVLGCLLLAGWNRRDARLWIFGWGWTLLFLAPFTFQPFVPGNGRFAYLASAGAALALGRLAGRGLDRAAARRSRSSTLPDRNAGRPAPHPILQALVLLLPVALLVHWGGLLAGYAAVYRQAGQTARTVAEELAAVAATTGAPRLFVTGYPRFLLGHGGTPLAQVMRYGLSDSISPPFRERTLPVYPLFEESSAAVVAAWGPASALARWDGGSFRLFEPVGDPLVLLNVEPDRAGVLRLHPLPDPSLRYRLVTATEGNTDRRDLPIPSGAEPLVIPLPELFLRSMHRLYGTPAWWWIEATDPDGGLRAATRPRAWPG